MLGYVLVASSRHKLLKGNICMGINDSVDATFDALDEAVEIVARVRKGSRNGVAQNQSM